MKKQQNYQKILKILTIFIFVLFIFKGYSQTANIITGKSAHFELKYNNDTINFIVLNRDLNVKKPIFLYCQGEDPIPLFLDYDDKGIFMYAGGCVNFDYKKIAEQYHIIVISKPKIPLISETTETFVNDFELKEYFNKNYENNQFLANESLENNTNRALFVLKFLSTQKWADLQNLVIVGYSQGAEVATNIAVKEKLVKKLVLLNPCPFGKIIQLVIQLRRDAEDKKISWEEADKKIQKLYERYILSIDNEVIRATPEIVSFGSFSSNLFEMWSKLNIPIFLGYGTSDPTTELCEMSPLFFIKANKTNLTLKRYFYLGHNFCQLDDERKEDISTMKWKEVMSDVYNWLQQN